MTTIILAIALVAPPTKTIEIPLTCDETREKQLVSGSRQAGYGSVFVVNGVFGLIGAGALAYFGSQSEDIGFAPMAITAGVSALCVIIGGALQSSARTNLVASREPCPATTVQPPTEGPPAPGDPAPPTEPAPAPPAAEPGSADSAR